MATNIFDTAKKAKSSSAKQDKVEVIIDDKDFHTSLSRLAAINKQLDSLKSEAVILTDTVKERSIDELVKIYNISGKYPGSFHITASIKNKPDASMLFIPTDKYLTIDEERFEALKYTFGDKLVEKTTTYIMDTKLVEKYGEVISELIMNCKKIKHEDKLNLISKSESFSIKKGTISNLKDFAKHSISTLINEIKPIFQLKSIRIIEK